MAEFRTQILRASAPVIAVAICIAVGLAALWALRYPMLSSDGAPGVLPTVWRRALLAGPDGRNWIVALVYATPILLTGLAVAVAFRAAVWNIGGQGQYLLGAIAAAAVGTKLGGSSALVIPMLLLASMLAGGIFAGIAAVLFVWRRVPVVLSTILLNFVALELLKMLLEGPMREPGGPARSEQLPLVARLPAWFWPQLHIGFWIALAVAGVVAVMIYLSTFGFRLRAVGENPIAARVAGIGVEGVALVSLFISGALAGLAGGIETSGQLPYQLFPSSGDSAIGFTGIAVALLGRLSPLGVIVAAIFFGTMNTAFRALENEVRIPFVMGQAMQGAIVIMILVLTRVVNKASGTDE